MHHVDQQINVPLNDWQNQDTPSISGKRFFENLGTHVIDFIQTLVVFGAIFALIYLFIAQPHKVSGNSMVPTFHNGDYILTDKVSFKISSPKRGDIIVFKNPRDNSQDFVKRIIGLPGDSVKIENNTLFLNDNPFDEQYLSNEIITRGGNFLPEGQVITVGENQYFVLGDNREHSSDSREWGTVPYDGIIGKTFFRYWPPTAFGFVKLSNLSD